MAVKRVIREVMGNPWGQPMETMYFIIRGEEIKRKNVNR